MEKPKELNESLNTELEQEDGFMAENKLSQQTKLDLKP